MKLEALTLSLAAITVATVDQATTAAFGISWPAITAAMTGAMVPPLFMPPERLLEAFRFWLGSVLMSLLTSSGMMLLFALDHRYAVLTSAALAIFARDIYAVLRGQLPPLTTALRERILGQHPPHPPAPPPIQPTEKEAP